MISFWSKSRSCHQVTSESWTGLCSKISCRLLFKVGVRSTYGRTGIEFIEDQHYNLLSDFDLSCTISALPTKKKCQTPMAINLSLNGLPSSKHCRPWLCGLLHGKV
jgi:hypothetical protein